MYGSQSGFCIPLAGGDGYGFEFTVCFVADVPVCRWGEVCPAMGAGALPFAGTVYLFVTLGAGAFQVFEGGGGHGSVSGSVRLDNGQCDNGCCCDKCFFHLSLLGVMYQSLMLCFWAVGSTRL